MTRASLAKSRRAATNDRAFAALAILTLAAAAGAQTAIVSPADRATLEGNTSTTYPLGRFDCRLQQLHADVPAATLHAHAYRRDATALAGQLPAFRTELEVQLSASPRTPATASRTFADNAGAQPTIVLPRTWISFPATDRPALDPAPQFEFVVPYAVPFSWSGGGALCLDISVSGNDRPSGKNTNFTPYTDAQEQLTSGLTTQPGFRYGSGCAAPGASSAAYADFDLRHLGAKMELDVAARNGVPSDTAGNAVSVLMLGAQRTATPWPLAPAACTVLTSGEFLLPLSGFNDQKGNLDVRLSDMRPGAPGAVVFAQIASVHVVTGASALSDGSRLTVPPPGVTPPTIARIVNGTDRTSATGTVSLNVAVTQFL